MLTDDELAYLRETQAEARPTQVNLYARTSSTSDGMGGRTSGYPGEGQPIQVRITKVSDSTPADDIPTDLASQYGASDLLRVTTDLVTIRTGDVIHDPNRGRWYAIVSDGDQQDWTTAQAVWATPTKALP